MYNDFAPYVSYKHPEVIVCRFLSVENIENKKKCIPR